MSDDLNKKRKFQGSDTRREEFAESFAVLEERGRGWQNFDYEVELEPVSLRFAPPQKVSRLIDDGRVPTFFSRLFSSKNNPKLLSNNECLPTDESAFQSPRPPVKTAFFRIHLPSELKNSFEQTEQMLLNLASSASFISFEIIGTNRKIDLQITCPAHESDAVSAQLKSHLPNVDFRKTEDLLQQNLQRGQTNEVIIADFGLGREWFIPLPDGRSFATDTLLPLVAAFEEITGSETACLQILFSRARQNWQGATRQALFDRNGKLVFANFQNHLTDIKEKLSKPLLAVQIRFVAASDSREKSLQITRRTRAFYRQFSSPNGNELIPLKNDRLPPDKHFQSFLSRTTYRSGMLISASELAAIVHLPSDGVE